MLELVEKGGRNNCKFIFEIKANYKIHYTRSMCWFTRIDEKFTIHNLIEFMFICNLMF